MKRAKKLLALVLSLAIALTMGVTITGTAFGLTNDGTISITGASTGDTATYYQIVRQASNGDWELNGTFGDLTIADIKALKGGEVTAAILNKIVANLGTSGVEGEAMTLDGTTLKATVDPGMYLVVAKPGPGQSVVYKPMVVSSDYYATNTTNTAAIKKQELTLDKTAEDQKSVDANKQETVAVGDTVDFTVNTQIPGYGPNYTNPVFKITDKLSTGLKLNADSVSVTAPEGLTKGTEYTVTPDGTKGFVLSFKADYLKTVVSPVAVTVTYSAEVTTDAVANVNHEDNTVTLNYSNSPDDTEGHGVLKDKTNHYTFDIDANLLGSDNYKATEVVKVGVDADGNEIEKTVTLDNGQTIGALEGAAFKLYKSEADAEADKNAIETNPAALESDGDGRIAIKGLDAGVYWLKETSAPAGYIPAQDPVKIEIKTVTDTVDVTETVDGQEVTYKTTVLKSYSVEINGVQTANYTITNDATTTHITKVSKGDTVVGTDANSGKIKNTQGTELPSTGGIGTTIFYLLGALLVVGCGIVLIARRRITAK